MTVTEPNITSPVEEAQPQKTSRWAAWRGMWFFPVAVLWMELVLRISTIGFDYPKGYIPSAIRWRRGCCWRFWARPFLPRRAVLL